MVRPMTARETELVTPPARVIEVRAPYVFVDCPYCHRTHVHSARLGLTAVKPSHCAGFRPYRLTQAGAA